MTGKARKVDEHESHFAMVLSIYRLSLVFT